MITRRQFFKNSTAVVAAGVTQTAEPTLGSVPLRAEPRVRWLHPIRTADDRILLRGDGPIEPQPLIRREVLDAAFGVGTHALLLQPDHWRMIEAGWFCGDDLFLPQERTDADYENWMAFHRPEVEAHDMLLELFGMHDFWLFGGRIEALGLTFERHPTAPRFVTVKLDQEGLLSGLTTAVSDLTDWIRIDQVVRPEVRDV